MFLDKFLTRKSTKKTFKALSASWNRKFLAGTFASQVKRKVVGSKFSEKLSCLC